MNAATIIHIYIVTIWILVATSILLAISNVMLWSHLNKMKQELSTGLLRLAAQLIDINNLMSSIMRQLRGEVGNGQVIPMRRPGHDNPWPTNGRH